MKRWMTIAGVGLLAVLAGTETVRAGPWARLRPRNWGRSSCSQAATACSGPACSAPQAYSLKPQALESPAPPPPVNTPPPGVAAPRR